MMMNLKWVTYGSKVSACCNGLVQVKLYQYFSGEMNRISQTLSFSSQVTKNDFMTCHLK